MEYCGDEVAHNADGKCNNGGTIDEKVQHRWQ
jgi:hypothetical protein